MLKLIICDDEPVIYETIRNMLGRFSKECGISLDVSTCASGEELLGAVTPDVDILLLDIRMGELSGMNAARKIREKNSDICIIFVTTMTQYALEGYKVHAFGFLKKPLTYAHLKAEEDVKRIHHDMKNHLIVLQKLIAQNENAASYVQDLMEEISGYGNLAETGNQLLNGLISEKMYQAAQSRIDLNACFDFTAGAFLDPMDVCAIFGNALDNAMEASKKVKDAERRSILVKCKTHSGNLVITFKNYFEGELKLHDTLPVSTKTGHLHGIGLNSIRRSVEKYGGSMAAECDAYHNFILTVVLPIPEKR